MEDYFTAVLDFHHSDLSASLQDFLLFGFINRITVRDYDEVSLSCRDEHTRVQCAGGCLPLICLGCSPINCSSLTLANFQD